MLDPEADADDVDVEHLAQVVRIGVDHEGRDLDAGIVDKDVEAAERGDSCLDGLLPLGLVGHVQRDEARLPAHGGDAIGGLAAEVVEDVTDHHRGPGGGECLGDAGPDAASTSGHERVPASQIEVAHQHPRVSDGNQRGTLGQPW